MWVLATRSLHHRPSTRLPIDMNKNCSANMYGGGDFEKFFGSNFSSISGNFATLCYFKKGNKKVTSIFHLLNNISGKYLYLARTNIFLPHCQQPMWRPAFEVISQSETKSARAESSEEKGHIVGLLAQALCSDQKF